MTFLPVRKWLSPHPNDVGRRSGWDIDFRQIEPRRMRMKVVLRPSENVTLLELHMDRKVHQRGCSPAGLVTVGLPVTPSIRSWNVEVPSGPGLIGIGMGPAFEGVKDSKVIGQTVSINDKYLARTSKKFGLSLPD
jgi:hypothetical protein